GGDEQRAYPWSTMANELAIDCSYANYGGASWPSTACVAAGAARVGSRSPMGDGRWNQADLAANASEWVLDYVTTPYPSPCDDCANLTPSGSRVVRGGGLINNT